jgi:hypothetical protein
MAMRTKKTASVFFSIALVGAGVLAAPLSWAAGNALMFHGGLVNAACETRLAEPGDSSSQLRPLKVNANLTLRLVSHDDACGKGALPLSVAYAERTSTTTDAHGTLVTLTYQ